MKWKVFVSPVNLYRFVDDVPYEYIFKISFESKEPQVYIIDATTDLSNPSVHSILSPEEYK